ncbi:cellulose synthase [Corchorus olitorius]|uniref:Cellulose synthase n=1 Tax=Corchorus olitorius TaxID=93759 RepID=A0A1R3K795_9ROSI|nr:cellulose synthase [Corchorus olitorius]
MVLGGTVICDFVSSPRCRLCKGAKLAKVYVFIFVFAATLKVNWDCGQQCCKFYVLSMGQNYYGSKFFPFPLQEIFTLVWVYLKIAVRCGCCLAGTVMEMTLYFVLWESALVVLLIFIGLFCPVSPSLLVVLTGITDYRILETIPRVLALRLHGGVAVVLGAQATLKFTGIVDSNFANFTCGCLAGTLMEMSLYFVLWESALVVLLIFIVTDYSNVGNHA